MISFLLCNYPYISLGILVLCMFVKWICHIIKERRINKMKEKMTLLTGKCIEKIQHYAERNSIVKTLLPMVVTLVVEPIITTVYNHLNNSKGGR